MVAPDALQRCLLSFFKLSGRFIREQFCCHNIWFDISIWIEMIADVEYITQETNERFLDYTAFADDFIMKGDFSSGNWHLMLSIPPSLPPFPPLEATLFIPWRQIWTMQVKLCLSGWVTHCTQHVNLCLHMFELSLLCS